MASSYDVAMEIRMLFCSGLLAFATISSFGENWPVWRGPRGDGSSLEKNPPTQWSTNSNVVWKVNVSGRGHSSPTIWGDHIFLTTAFEDTQERALLAFDRKNGQQLWKQIVLRAPLERKNPENSYASSTPVTDGKLVYVTFLNVSNLVVAAYDFNGNQVWHVEPGTFFSEHGFSHTPALYENKVIVACQSKAENFIVALDVADGHTVWKTKLENPSQSYSPAFIREMAGRPQMIVSGNSAIASYDPRNGSRLWFYKAQSSDFVVTPVYNEKNGTVLSSSSWPKKVLVCIKPDGEGDITGTKVVWSNTVAAPYVPSPISVGDWFFTVNFQGKDACCLNAATGEILWKEPMGGFHASPVAANGNLYFVNDEGTVRVVKAGPKYELVSQIEMGEQTFASPSISDGQIFLRTATTLYCIGRKP